MPTPILILGAQPDALVLACDLQRRDIAAQIASPALTPHNNAPPATPETRRVLRDLGFPHTALAHTPLPSLLRDALQHTPAWGQSLRAISQDDTGVTVSFTSGARLRCRYLVASTAEARSLLHTEGLCFQLGRALLIGEAARGHASVEDGIQDAYCLGWRLALALTLPEPDAARLLADYAAERPADLPERVPDAELAWGCLSDELQGTDHVAILFGDGDEVGDAAAALERLPGVHAVVVNTQVDPTGAAAARFRARRPQICLVRPDGRLAWRGYGQPVDRATAFLRLNRPAR